MEKLLFVCLSVLILFLAIAQADPVPAENVSSPETVAESGADLETADSIGYGYYAAPLPLYYGRTYGIGGYGGSWRYGGYGGYGSYGRYYRRPIYPVWG